MSDMDYKNNLEDQRKLLEKHLGEINTIASAKLGIRVHLEIVEHTNYQKLTTLGLKDKVNARGCCGIMAHAFKEVYIDNFNMWWNETGVIFDLHFSCNYIDGGSDGFKFCTMQIENDLVKINERF